MSLDNAKVNADDCSFESSTEWVDDGRSHSRCHFAFPTMHSNEVMAFVECHLGGYA
jgi:hypothetical protein